MATITHGNWSFQEPPFQDGDVIEGCNCSQLVSGTIICAGKSLTFNNCNLVNVKIDPAWAVNEGNNAQISHCSHVHPEWIERGLPECPEMCAHVVGTDEIRSGEELLHVEHHYEDTVLE